MSNYRIKLIAALSAIAFAVSASPMLAQATSGTTSSQRDSSSSSSSTGADQTSSTSPSSSSSDPASSAAGPSSGSTSGSSSTSPRAAASSSDSTSGVASERSPSSRATMASATEQVRAANEDDQKRTVGEYKGQKITGANGEDFGKVNDFVVDTQSGKVAFAVVSSGGFLGMGDKLRLVEHNSLQPQAAAEGFTAQMDKVAFEALPVITQQDLDAGRISGDQKKAASNLRSSASTSSSSSEMSPTGKYALASKLSGKSARAGEQEAGSISDIVIDIENGQANALFEPKSEFAGSSGKFLVPLNKFEVGSPQAQVIATTLSRSDFTASTQPSPGSSTTETLTPTGRSSSTSTAASGTSSLGISSSPSSSPDSNSSPDTTPTSKSSSSGLGSTSPSSGGAGSTSTGSASSGSFGSPSSTTSSSDTSSAGSATSRIGSTDTSSPALSSSSQTPSHTPDRATTSSPSVAGIGTTTSGAAVSTDEQLTPTGRTSAVTESGESISPSSIRSALRQDTTLAQENVEVEAKIVLRGTVSSEAMKARAEDLARRAGQNAQIDNQITVENR